MEPDDITIICNRFGDHYASVPGVVRYCDKCESPVHLAASSDKRMKETFAAGKIVVLICMSCAPDHLPDDITVEPPSRAQLRELIDSLRPSHDLN